MLIPVEIEHLRRRLVAEETLAASTASLAARLVHEELARIYRQRLQSVNDGNQSAD